MDSSTSHSKAVPRRAVLLVAAALASWVACALYTLYLNPEVNHYRDGDTIKRAWAAQMTREHGSKIVVFGGSSCEFSIDGERLLANYGEPVVNEGRNAGMGAVVLTESALADLRRGDTLIIALEPDLLSVPLKEEPSLAVQFSFGVHHPEWVLYPQLGVGQINCVRAATDLRPGGYHAFTLLGKWMRREPLYRYQLRDYHRSGWAETAVRLPLTGEVWKVGSLSDDARILLANLSRWCEAKGVRVAYSLPWSYCSPDQTRVLHKWNAGFVADMMDYLPVLRDSSFGADPMAADFADTPLHLTVTGAARRTDEFGHQLQQWDTWTRESLKQATMELQAPAQAK
jgi:hypothetical protein